ncbi:Nitroreductase [Flexibacter flexilis DSM 6793]|uniref:Nitroreductase n=1 Tax=Flexibacter flexilis DSM 6793 TaxID=927664 RepID=A0A1I1G974_9BACT|nr:nitroreductase family protein [Flexibacter flexilis]SFC06388.1 Nitroreductase [Flexibacter flexilis DSM 6793]
MSSFISDLWWRYAPKFMNGEVVPDEKIHNIVEAARLAPTSNGLQPFEILIISNKELKEKIFPIAYRQQPIVACSHLLVFAVWDTYTPERIHEAFDVAVTELGGDSDNLQKYRNAMLNSYPNQPADENYHHTAKQAYLALGLCIAAAAIEKVDATPMEGFDAQALDSLLGFDQQRLRSVLLLPLGYRDEAKDWRSTQKKIRKSAAMMVKEIK